MIEDILKSRTNRYYMSKKNKFYFKTKYVCLAVFYSKEQFKSISEYYFCFKIKFHFKMAHAEPKSVDKMFTSTFILQTIYYLLLIDWILFKNRRYTIFHNIKCNIYFGDWHGACIYNIDTYTRRTITHLFGVFLMPWFSG